MEPRKTFRVSTIKTNSATIDPRLRVKYNRAWIVNGGGGRIPPLQFLKAVAWCAEHIDAFQEKEVVVNKPYDKSFFTAGLNLPPGFTILFNNTTNSIQIYNKYGNLDYKTLGCLMLMTTQGDKTVNCLSKGSVEGLFPAGLKSFNDQVNLQDRLVPLMSGFGPWMSTVLAHIGNPLGLEDPFIEVYDGNFQMFTTPEEQDTELSTVLEERYGITGLEKSKFRGPALSELVMNLKLGMNTMCVGPTGTGKSECVLEAFTFADAERDTRVIEGHESLREIDLLGGYVPGQKGEFNWADGVLIQAMRHGSYLFVDEANRMPTRTLNVLLGVLSRGKVLLTDHGSEEVACQEGFTVVMAMNQGQGYSVNSLDRALIDRFPTVIEFRYLSAKEELELLVERTGIDPKIGGIMVKIGNDVRELARIGEFETGISPRGLFAWAGKYMSLVSAGPVNHGTLVTTAIQTWVRGVAGVGVDGYMEREVVNKLTAMIYDART